MASIDRRHFLSRAAASLGVASAGLSLGFDPLDELPGDLPPPPAQAPDDVRLAARPQRPDYNGPNVILIRFGGGVRRLETIQGPENTYCPFIYHELARNQGVLFNNVEITTAPGVDTSHGQGTLYILTGQYRHYEDIDQRLFGNRFETADPTLFEYFRRAYNVPAHQALLINGEDRIDEEFFTFSNHHLYGARYRSTVLSLYRFKTYLVRQRLRNEPLGDRERRELEVQLRRMESLDYRMDNRNSEAVQGPELDAFWDKWRRYYGDSGLVNPRGDRLLTTLTLWAMRELRPRLMMINYQDPDYVHWGPPSFYTRAISVIDEGVREIYNAVRADEFYRDNTVFVVIPDCGRDNNRCVAVPFQHHFNTSSARDIFAVIAGPRRLIDRPGAVIDRAVEQTGITRAVADLMGFQAHDAEAPSLLDRI